MSKNENPFATNQVAPTLWLFADMLKDKTGTCGRKRFLINKTVMHKSKSGKDIPCIIAVGSAFDKDKQPIEGEFICSVWNFKPSESFSKQYPSWTDVPPDLAVDLTCDGSRIIVDLPVF